MKQLLLIAQVASLLCINVGPGAGVGPALGQWVTHGATPLNRRWAEGETVISPQTVGRLKLQWNYSTPADVTATPAVFNGVVYFPDWAGFLYALDQRTGATIWKKSFSADYGFAAGTFARATPALASARSTPALKQDILVIGTYTPAIVIAVTAKTGSLLWKTTVGDFPVAAKPRITGAATIFQDLVFVGVASGEEGSATDPDYECCVFKGSLARLNLVTGKLQWQAYTLPDLPGYSGAAIWAATPAVDAARKLVYAGVGNMYTLPPSVQKCIEDNPNRTSPDPCIVPGNNQNSIISLNIANGNYKWSRSLGPIDAWTAACFGGASNPNCPPVPGDDYDFGLNPVLITIPDPRPGKRGKRVDVAVAGQKSGIIFALDRSTGEVVWSVQAGPGGVLGGISWGMATDGLRIYAGNINSGKNPFYLSTLNTTVTSGAWFALNASTGQPLWYFPNPDPSPNWAMLPSVANGVVFAGSADKQGTVYGFDAASGKVLWQFKAGTSVYGGISISKGCIYFGHGYGSLSGFFGTTGGGPQSVYSFCIA